jgi:tRNA-splicing ligase RtcB (3'-phosphate/5'-hydroxy nucleic acid ligase)
MSEAEMAPVRTWLAAPLGHKVSGAIERLRRSPDVQQIAVMPDVHLSADVCIGVVVATSHLIYRQAVGGDIGCGMLAVALDIESESLGDPRVAGRVLANLAGQCQRAAETGARSCSSPRT